MPLIWSTVHLSVMKFCNQNHVGRILDLDAVAMPENMVMLTLKAPPVFSATEISGREVDWGLFNHPNVISCHVQRILNSFFRFDV